MKWRDWNSSTAVTAEMHCKSKNSLWKQYWHNWIVFDDHWDNISLVHECITIKAGCVDYEENNFYFL